MLERMQASALLYTERQLIMDAMRRVTDVMRDGSVALRAAEARIKYLEQENQKLRAELETVSK